VSDKVLGGGAETVLSGGTASATVVSAGGLVIVSSGGTTSGAVISSGGAEYAYLGGTAVATAGIETINAGSASALFNMGRNLGGAIGIAGLQTWLSKREQFHSNTLSSAVSLFQDATRARIDELTRFFIAHGATDPAYATHQAIIAIGLRVRQQANIMAFSDTFFVLGAALVLALLATALLRRPDQLQAGSAH